MQEQAKKGDVIVVGFYTKRSAASWFWSNGQNVETLREKDRKPQGNGTPHLIQEIKLLTEGALDNLYPDGIVLDQEFDKY